MYKSLVRRPAVSKRANSQPHDDPEQGIPPAKGSSSPMRPTRRKRVKGSLFGRRLKNPVSCFQRYATNQILIILLVIILVLVLHLAWPTTTSPAMPISSLHGYASHVQGKVARFPRQRTWFQPTYNSFPLLLHPSSSDAGVPIVQPPMLTHNEEETMMEYDFGDLDLHFFDEFGSRSIYRNLEDLESDFRDPDKARDDDYEMYLAYDDDYEKSENTKWSNPDYKKSKVTCRRTPKHRASYQTCNMFHESPLIDSGGRSIGHGAYRDVFGILHQGGEENERVILKALRYGLDVKLENFEFVRMDAMVAERLSSSPRIYDIYGFCGQSIISEFFPHGDMETLALPNSEDNKEATPEYPLRARNKFTSMEKLNISLQMAEALADLHGDPDGVITHQDIQLAQYLWNKDLTVVKLNDFNRAEFMLFDERHNRYCKYYEGPGNGSWRSPEEYHDWALDEKVDIFALGNNFYSILTGLEPFYDAKEDEDIKARVIKKETAFIDPRWKEQGTAEKRLVEVIEKCFAFEPEDRPSVFELVTMLRDAVAEAEEAK